MFLERKLAIEEGCTIIAYVNPSSMKAITVKSGELYSNKYGQFEHSGTLNEITLEMIGKLFGCKFANKKNTGFIHLLYPTPEIWTLALPHRTQILYHADISFITSLLELRPGVNVYFIIDIR
jgi:tRNA (adenine57-N1/adenine58-N1)-methyltransferase